jgi:hypothetical protein
MIQLRRGTFETNSSSSHSLVVTKGVNGHYSPEEAYQELNWDMYDENGKPWPHDEGIWMPSRDMYFGRAPFRILMTFEEKLRYAYACAPIRERRSRRHGYTYSREYYKVTNVLKKFIPKIKGVKFKTKYIGTDDCCLGHWLKELDISLIEFLTNKNIVVICDGDEYCIWEDMKKVGLVKEENFEKELF